MRPACAFLIPLIVLAAQPAASQTGREVLVVVNAANPDSVRIGSHYASRRGVPADQVLRLTSLPSHPDDGVDRELFERAIQAPIAAWLGRHQAQDRILFIVLTKGVPLRINAPAGEQSAASVDSELTLLYARLTGARVPLEGPLANPLFLGEHAIAAARPISRDSLSVYLVTRLDGFTVEQVIALIDRSLTSGGGGRFVLDGKSDWSGRQTGNAWLLDAADRLKAAGLPPDQIVSDQSGAVLADLDDVMGYYSWGSNDPAIRRREFSLEFRDGAIGGMFVSTDARTFREPPKDWKVGEEQKSAWFAGTPQSLAGDLIAAGITGVAGHVAEPLLRHTIRPNILFPAYLAGFTLAEAFYLAMPSLSWMTVVVGDPLCAPFARAARKLVDPPIDSETELPVHFSQRRLAALDDPKVPVDARKALLRAESRLRREHLDGARADLERATSLAPQLLVAQMMLADIYERTGRDDAAIARYRAALDTSPESVAALNNLAYLLAVRKGDLRAAQPLAERALELAPSSGEVADTYGWILHLGGNARRALEMLSRAAQWSPRNPEIQLHLAQVHAATGDRAASQAALARAIELDPALAQRAEVKALQSR